MKKVGDFEHFDGVVFLFYFGFNDFESYIVRDELPGGIDEDGGRKGN